jgi:NAD(P)H dehydrogenase (quinone)
MSAMTPSPRLLVTGATGQLGRLVIDHLLATTPPGAIAALARSTAAASDLAARGIEVRVGDYDDAASLDRAVTGIDRVLLISSSAIGSRTAQHARVIEASRKAGVGLLVYTSLLHADRSPLGLAVEHRETEAAVRASGVPCVILRNGWYSENHTASIPSALAHGAVFGCAGDGRFSTASRADYAAAAAIVLTTDGHAGRVYELAGDAAYTLADFAAEVARAAGRGVSYRNLPEADFQAALRAAGLPDAIAAMLAGSDTGAAAGALHDDRRQLSALIGRPTTPLAATVAAALGMGATAR